MDAALWALSAAQHSSHIAYVQCAYHVLLWLDYTPADEVLSKLRLFSGVIAALELPNTAVLRCRSMTVTTAAAGFVGHCPETQQVAILLTPRPEYAHPS